MKTLAHKSAKRLAAICFNAADRLLDLGLRTFEQHGAMTPWDIVVVRLAYWLLCLGNLLVEVNV